MKRRIEAMIVLRFAQEKDARTKALLPVYHLFTAGALTRREFSQMTRLRERIVRSLISKLLHD